MSFLFIAGSIAITSLPHNCLQHLYPLLAGLEDGLRLSWSSYHSLTDEQLEQVSLLVQGAGLSVLFVCQVSFRCGYCYTDGPRKVETVVFLALRE